MTHTVIGMFDSDFNAQDAVDELINHGFDRSNISVNNQRDVTGETREMRDAERDEKRESGIVRFFKNLFGDDDDDADKYSAVAMKSGAVITVYTKNEEEAGRAADILDDKGAFDVDEQASKYGYTPQASNLRSNQRDTTPNMNTQADRTYPSTGQTKPQADTGWQSQSQKKRDGNANLTSTETPRREVPTGAGVGEVPTAGKRSRSRIIEYRGQESARLREDRDNETKFW